MPRAIDVSVSLVNFAGASCRSGRDAPRTSTASIKQRQQNASDFTTTHKHSLSGAEFPPARNVASARDLKSVSIVSSETDNPHQILPSSPVLPTATFALPAIVKRFAPAGARVRTVGSSCADRGNQASLTKLTNSESAVARHRFLAVVRQPRCRGLRRFPASQLPMLPDDRLRRGLARHLAR